jgi:hypothetical protein
MEKRTARIKAQYAYNSRPDVGCPPDVLAGLKRDYHAARLAENIRRVVQEAGPFTAEQARELTRIITGKVEVAA